jgi:tetratricopeptide (TPR) repeat protein
LADAVQHFNVALKSQPDYFDAHYNLASALAAPEDFAGAAREFDEAAKLNPGDTNANHLARENLQQLDQLTTQAPR